jgi:hypothetical protein
MDDKWVRKEGRVWLSSGRWSAVTEVFEYRDKVRGLTMWAHVSLIASENPVELTERWWVISEASCGLRLNINGFDTKEAALKNAIDRLEPFTDERLAEIVKKEIVKQVTHQLQG